MKKTKLGDKVRVQHILDAIIDLETCMKGIYSYEQFMQDTKARFSTAKLVEIIGEASNHISDELKAKYSDIDWKAIVGMRNILVHEYFGISYQDIWDTMQANIPDFKRKMQQILKDLL